MAKKRGIDVSDLEHEFVSALRKAGLTEAEMRLLASPSGATELLSKLRGGSVSLNLAKQIMGPDHFLCEEIADEMGFSLAGYTLHTVPFGEHELIEAKYRGLYLVAMDSLLLRHMRVVMPTLFSQGVASLATTPARAGWHLIGELPGSVHESSDVQQSMQPGGFETPLAVEVAYVAVANLLAHTGVAFPHFLRTLDVDVNGKRISVGYDITGTQVHFIHSEPEPGIGLAIGTDKFRHFI